MRLIHVGLRCRSEENADKFYANLLGLRKQEPKILAGSLSKQIFELTGDREFRIINYTNHQLHFEIFIDSRYIIDRERVSHICIDVGDINGFLDKCRTMGLAIRQIPKGDKIVTFVSDFDGNLFEITG